ncbi:MAG: hypothetical protein QOG38_1137 [Hyphomicrobiales bacterium]|jgi:hypothetical protein|nr:hypothetical protein [Hyphomicrobiales bacterium]
MIRFVFRSLGLWILAAGFVALVRDGTKSIAGNAVFTTALREDWTNIHASSLQALEGAIAQRVDPYVGGWVWDPVVLAILSAPTFVVLGVLGSVLILIGRRKKPLIGYGRD